MTGQSQLRKEQLLWCASFAVAVCWPLFLFEYPSGQDTPNHLARAFILLNPDDVALGANFEVRWKPVPNLAWDVFVVSVGRFLPLSWTLKAFIMLGYALTLVGVFLLNRVAAGRWTWAPLAAAPFLFHAGTSKGFLSFAFGVGLALIASAWWAANPEKNWVRRLVVASLLSLLLFYVHFAAWAIYGVFVLGWELTKLVRLHRDSGAGALGSGLLRLGRDGMQGALPFAVMALIARYNGTGTSHVGETTGLEWPFTRIAKAHYIIDTGHWLPSVLFLSVISLFLFSLLARRSLGFSKQYGLAIVLLIALFFVVPNSIRGTMYVVWRISLGATLIAIASAIPTEAIHARSSRFRLAVVLTVTMGLSGWQALSSYHTEAARADFLSLIADLPEGGSMFMAHSGISLSEMEFDRLGIHHLGAYAVLERRIAVQNLFANPAQQPIVYRRPSLNHVQVFLERLEGSLGEQQLTTGEYLAQFDWVVIHGPDRDLERRLLEPDDYSFVGEVGLFRLYCNAGAVSSGFVGRGEGGC